MGIQEIFKVLMVFILPAGGMALILLAIFAFVYFVVYRNKSKEAKRRILRKPIVGILMLGYFFVVLGITSLSRSASFLGSFNFNIFSGLIEAWNAYSLIAFQLIVFNVIMFIPLGILLPLFSDKFKKFGWTFLAILSATLSIEIFQLATGRGIFDFEDLMTNMLGGVMGYHFYMLVAGIIENKKTSFKELCRHLAIPIIVVSAFAGMHMAYQLQEFGNLSINPSVGTDMSRVKLSTSIPLSSKQTTAPVYINKCSNDIQRGKDIAKLLQKELDLPELTGGGRDGSNVQFTYAEEEGTSYYISYTVLDGTWGLRDNYYQEENVSKKQNDELLQKAKTLLVKNKWLPEQAVLVASENGDFHWRIQDPKYDNTDLTDGYLMIGLRNDGTVQHLNNGFTENDFVGQVNILSPEEAYNKIKNGEFDQMNPFEQGDVLVITRYELTYMYDTKGYYQPVYRFRGDINGESHWGQQISARKN